MPGIDAMIHIRSEAAARHAEAAHYDDAEIAALLADPAGRKTTPFLQRYEFALIVGIRARQLEDGGAPLVPIDGLDTDRPDLFQQIAQREVLNQKSPFIIVRAHPDGIVEAWQASELKLPPHLLLT